VASTYLRSLFSIQSIVGEPGVGAGAPVALVEQTGAPLGAAAPAAQQVPSVDLFDELPFGSTDIDVPLLSKGQLEAKRALEQAGIQCDLSHIGAIPVKHGIFRDGAADKRFKLAQKRKAKMAEWFRAAVRNRKH